MRTAPVAAAEAAPSGVDPETSRRPSANEVLVVRILREVTEELAAELWSVHEEAFVDFPDQSAFLMPCTEDEFAGYMSNPQVQKVVVWVDGVVAGFTLNAIDVRDVWWVDARFFDRRYPGRSVLYVMYSAIAAAHRGPRVIRAMFETGLEWAAERDMIVAFDTSNFNVERRFVDLIERIAKRATGSHVAELSSQHFYALDSGTNRRAPSQPAAE
ncbi:MAG: hypothetical protein ACOYNI_02920 [Acidimicrobiia bacterium]